MSRKLHKHLSENNLLKVEKVSSNTKPIEDIEADFLAMNHKQKTAYLFRLKSNHQIFTFQSLKKLWIQQKK